MNPLVGHDKAVSSFLGALESGRLHHAWLITGPEGIGKAHLATKAAARLLADKAGPAIMSPGLEIPSEHPIARLIAAGSHPDLLRLERLIKNDGGELARSISVAQVRSLQRLFSTTPSLSPWRVVLIDSIDDLERSAANALLKHLEEPPPNSLFLLVSHSPERLLPTIRSRCRLLRLAPLGHDVMASALRSALPDADENEIESLIQTGGGAPGRAIAFRGLDISGLDLAMERLAIDGDPTNAGRSALAYALSLKSAQPRYEAFLARAPSMIAFEARQRKGRALAEALSLWERASQLASGARQLSLDPQSIVFELAGMIAALAPARGGRPD